MTAAIVSCAVRTQAAAAAGAQAPPHREGHQQQDEARAEQGRRGGVRTPPRRQGGADPRRPRGRSRPGPARCISAPAYGDDCGRPQQQPCEEQQADGDVRGRVVGDRQAAGHDGERHQALAAGTALVQQREHGDGEEDQRQLLPVQHRHVVDEGREGQEQSRGGDRTAGGQQPPGEQEHDHADAGEEHLVADPEDVQRGETEQVVQEGRQGGDAQARGVVRGHAAGLPVAGGQRALQDVHLDLDVVAGHADARAARWPAAPRARAGTRWWPRPGPGSVRRARPCPAARRPAGLRRPQRGRAR